jgi:hypothetical protein
MTVAAKDAVAGKIYRLTRESGTTYYKICDAASVRRLEKRLSTQSIQSMKPADRFAWAAIGRCRSRGHVLSVRILRYRDDGGRPHEAKAYVDFPPDYVLREVERPPGYSAGRRRGLDNGGAEAEDS